MNIIKLASALSLMAINTAQATMPCNEFQLKIENQSAENLLITNINLTNANIAPAQAVYQLDARSEQVFKIIQSAEEITMSGEIALRSYNELGKEVKIQFDLKNIGSVCDLTNKTQSSNYAIQNSNYATGSNYVIYSK